MFDEVRRDWSLLEEPQRKQVELVCLPMEDPDEDGAIVNALQRQADVVVKKSLEEAFGLGVTEAMWKRRPVVATRIGGIRDLHLIAIGLGAPVIHPLLWVAASRG